MITHKRLQELLHYNAESGMLYWRVSRGSCKAGDVVAGDVHRSGHLRIRIDGSRYYAHRLAWLYMTGEHPNGHMDHINGVRNDNRISNLRIATPSQNAMNSLVQKRSTSGLKGASFHKAKKKWQARCIVDGKRKHLGLFATKEEAHAAYCAAAKREYGGFFNTGTRGGISAIAGNAPDSSA